MIHCRSTKDYIVVTFLPYRLVWFVRSIKRIMWIVWVQLVCLCLLLGEGSNTDQVDAVPVAGLVGKIVAQMSSRGGYAFAVREASHLFPVGFFIPETRPSVALRFLDKVLHRSTDGSSKKQGTRH